MGEKTTVKRMLGVEVEIEPEKSITCAVDKPSHYAHSFIDALLSNEDVTREFFLRYPEVARVQFYVDDIIRMDLRRPDDVEEETQKTLATIGEKLYGFEPTSTSNRERPRRVINNEEELQSARSMETSNDLNAMAATIRALWKERDDLRARVTQYETMMMSLPHFDRLREIMARALREDRDFLPAPTRHLFPCGTQQNDMLHTLIRLFARAVDLELARWRFASTVSSVRKYPREVVCLNCEEVVAYATINAVPQSPMLAAELIRPDGSYPEACDPGCLNCLPGGPFRLRDRVTGEWIGEPPPKDGGLIK